MAFERRAIIDPKASEMSKTGCTAHLFKFGKETPNAEGPVGLIIQLSNHRYKQLKLQPGDTFDYFIGTGDDRGVIHLEVVEKGEVEPDLKNLKHAEIWKFSLGPQPDFPNVRTKPEHCSVERLEGTNTIEIVLPVWADKAFQQNAAPKQPNTPNGNHSAKPQSEMKNPTSRPPSQEEKAIERRKRLEQQTTYK